MNQIQIKLKETVLDLGCGTGELTDHAATLVGPHGKVIGIDPDVERIHLARNTHAHGEFGNCILKRVAASDSPAKEMQILTLSSPMVLSTVFLTKKNSSPSCSAA